MLTAAGCFQQMLWGWGYLQNQLESYQIKGKKLPKSELLEIRVTILSRDLLVNSTYSATATVVTGLLVLKAIADLRGGAWNRGKKKKNDT